MLQSFDWLIVKATENNEYVNWKVVMGVRSAPWLNSFGVVTSGNRMKQFFKRSMLVVAEVGELADLISDITFCAELFKFFHHEWNAYTMSAACSLLLTLLLKAFQVLVFGFYGLFFPGGKGSALLYTPFLSICACMTFPVGVLDRVGEEKAPFRAITMVVEDIPQIVVSVLFLRREEFSWQAAASAALSAAMLTHEAYTLARSFARQASGQQRLPEANGLQQAFEQMEANKLAEREAGSFARQAWITGP